ncbi:tyrosine-type recombinase/integrase [Peribacillus frigoritolerans]|uniref:tyrosine-type recombinase/integrase n=1 Tax=Peribacillus frigoritolerans TaxID=450367 RepID=UPI0035D64F2D
MNSEKEYSLFLGSGIRVNELSNLRLRDLDFEEKQIHVLRKGGKKDVVAVSPPRDCSFRSLQFH